MQNAVSANEVWKDVIGYEGIYRISSIGNVKSLGNNKNRKEKILKPSFSNGYGAVSLSRDTKVKSFNIHVLVAVTFIGGRPKGLVVDHIDGNPRNNEVSNLQYISNRENCIKGKMCILKKGKSSKYVGVCRNYKSKSSPWSGQIIIDGKNKHIGLFKTELQAAKAYDRIWAKCS